MKFNTHGAVLMAALTCFGRITGDEELISVSADARDLFNGDTDETLGQCQSLVARFDAIEPAEAPEETEEAIAPNDDGDDEPDGSVSEEDKEEMPDLLGSDVQPASWDMPPSDVGGAITVVTLGEVVNDAFSRSGLTAEGWNDLTQQEREDAISIVAAEVELAVADRGDKDDEEE